MADDQSRIRQIAWLELFPWLRLVRALRLAFSPRMLVLAAIGVAATMYGWELIGSFGIFQRGDVAEKKAINGARSTLDEVNIDRPEERSEAQRLAAITAARSAIEEVNINRIEIKEPEVSVSVLDPATSRAQYPWQVLSRPFQALFESGVTVASFTYLLLCGLWALLVWSLFGAAITRSAALWFAREDRLGFRRSLGWGVAKWPAYVGGALFPLAGVLIAVLPAAAIGLLLKFGGFFALLAGILWFLVLLCALFIAILLVGLLFGWPLIWGTISVEGTDSFDAVSRSYSYTYQRPVHYLFYAIVAGILGMLGWIAVIIFYRGVETYSYWAASWGSGVAQTASVQDIIVKLDGMEAGRRTGLLTEPQIEAEKKSLENQYGSLFVAGATVVRFWLIVVQIIAVGFLFSYFWCAATFIYYLLRQSVDATEMDEVAVDEEAETFALPPMQQEPGAPPQIADIPPPASS